MHHHIQLISSVHDLCRARVSVKLDCGCEIELGQTAIYACECYLAFKQTELCRRRMCGDHVVLHKVYWSWLVGELNTEGAATYRLSPTCIEQDFL